MKSIHIFGNDITNLKALSGLKIIDNLEISSTRIKNLDDLKNVDTIRNFVFKLNHHIKSMDFYDRIQTSYLVISECDSLIEIINNPFYVLHILSIYDNKSLKNINNLNITQCYSVDIDGFTLDNLSLGPHTKTSIMHIFRVKTLEGIQTFETNYLDMSFTTLLNIDEVNSFNNLNYIRLSFNKYLSECSIPLICSNLDNPKFNLILLDNSVGCNTKEEIRQKCLSSTDESSNLQSYKLYPKPASYQVSIKGLTETANIDIFDMHGRNIKSIVSDGIPIEVSSLNSGPYILCIKKNKNRNA